ncbi:MAG TPA: IS21 family transposase [Acidimicrobiales bacterium]|nr:IS21 family transposase [Acidimicrobiales bacterium]
MIDVEEWAEIRRLHRAEAMGIKAIARRLGVARNTVRSALRAEEAPKYEREGRGSAVDAFEPEIRRLLGLTPDMPATVVAERIGWTRGITVLRERVAELRPAYQVPEAFGRTEYKPGELCQWDLWFPDYEIPVGHGQAAVLPVLVGVTCYSRWILARMIGSKESTDVLGGHLDLVVELGKVPRMGVYDGEPAISVRRGKRLIYTEAYLRLKGTLAMGSIVLAKGHPERKGVVERANGYLETSFMPGRSFADQDDFNTQLGDWLETRANLRVHSGLRCRPSERIDEDLAAMIALPPVLPDMDSHRDLRLPADHWVRHQTNDYSVHPKAVGRRIHVTVDGARVTAKLGNEVVASHERSLASHVTVTDPVHDRAREAARALRGVPKPSSDEVEVRNLAVYDEITGAA